MMIGSQSEHLESSYYCAQKLLHDNVTLINDDATHTKAEKFTDNHQLNPYERLKRRVLVASAGYLNAESTGKEFDNGLFELMVKIIYLSRYCLIDSVFKPTKNGALTESLSESLCCSVSSLGLKEYIASWT